MAIRVHVLHSPHFGRSRGPAIRRAVIRGLQSAALRGKSTLAQETQRKAANTGQLARSWRTRALPKGALLLNSQAYMAVIEFGRRPGAMPPVEAIELWVRRKLRGEINKRWTARRAKYKWVRSKRARRARKLGKRDFKKREARSLAWAIAKNIKRKGTAPRWIVRGARPALKRQIRAEVRREVLWTMTQLAGSRR